MTGEMTCHKDVSPHVDFPRTPLSSVVILGNVLHFASKRWILCPQPNCSIPCVMDNDPAHYNSAGFECSYHQSKAPDKKRKRANVDLEDESTPAASKSKKKKGGAT
jgi:hypothetical protein